MSERKFKRVCATCEFEYTQFPNCCCIGCQETPKHPNWQERSCLRRGTYIIEDMPTDSKSRLTAMEKKQEQLGDWLLQLQTKLRTIEGIFSRLQRVLNCDDDGRNTPHHFG